MRLTLIIDSITSGGAERVISIMANYWVAKGWEINLLTFDDGKVPPFYNLDSHIHHVCLGIAMNSPNPIIAIWNNLKRIQILRSAIINSNPDVVISFMNQINIVVLLATRWLNIPVVVSERNDPATDPLSRIWKQLRQWTYPFADRIVLQTNRALNYFSLPLQTRACVIPNPVLLPPFKQEPSEGLSRQRAIAAMGRLVTQKGFDLLLQAFAKLKNRYPEWTVTILGEGHLRSELEALCHQLELSDRVDFPGAVGNIYERLQQADIFVMSSRFEGFPNALCEAMACGLPVISTDCPSGPREIIRDGIDGILVPNQDLSALTVAMDRLMSDEKERKRLAWRALEVTERFSLEKIMGMWEKLLAQVVEEKL